jgi:hypothetical protein
MFFANAAAAAEFTLLTAGRRSKFVSDVTKGSGRANIRVGRDRGLATLEDPTQCPSSSAIQIRFYTSADSLRVGGDRAELPCGNWKATANGYAYRDRTGAAGGVTKIRYSSKRLKVKAATPGYLPVPGPVGFAQLGLDVGTVRYLVRMHSFRRNDASKIQTRKLSKEADEGEAAFWDTLWGIEDRAEETMVLLGTATGKDPSDARSFFLQGLMRLNRFGRETTYYPEATPAQAMLVEEALEDFEQALPSLWDGSRGDTRAPGFAATARYTLGVLRNDPTLIAQGSQEMDFATALNPLFNTFIPLGPIPPIFRGTDPEYQAVVQLIDEYFPEAATQCGDQGEICFNEGLAPHNLAGTFLFFGDIFAKGDRVESARLNYETAVTFGTANGWRPEFLAAAQDRLDNVDARVALYQDADPANDPPLLGVSNNTCAYCHYR